MENNNQIPPRLAEFLLGKLLSRNIRYSVLGDFEEIFFDIKSERGYLLAAVWYWWQVFKSLPLFLKDKIFWGGVMFTNYLKIAVRNFISHKVYASINLFGLVLGLTCSLLIIFYVKFETSYDTHLSDAENKYRILRANREIDGKNRLRWMPAPMGKVLKSEVPEIKKSARIDIEESRVKYGENVFLEDNFAFADPDFLDIFNVELTGRKVPKPLADINSIIISERAAMKYFGDENPVGKSIFREDTQEFLITGVFKDMPENSHIHMDFIANYNRLYSLPEESRWINSWRFMDPSIYVELNEQANPELVASKIEGIYLSNLEEGNEINLYLQKLEDIHTNTKVFWEIENPTDPKYLYMFLTIAVIILLIASFNYMSITTARATVREKEIGIRKVIGADRKKIAYQFLSEAFVFTLTGTALALVSTSMLLPFFSNLVGVDIPFSFFEQDTLLILLIVLILVSLISGSYPAFLISAFQPQAVFNNISSLGKSRSGILRSALVVFQFAISAFLIISTIFVHQQREFIRDKDLGFEKEQILCMKYLINENVNLKNLKNEFLKHPAVDKATITASLPDEINQMGFVRDWEGKEEDERLRISRIFVDYNFLDFFGMNLLQGRTFSESYVTDKTEAYIINQQAAQALGWEDPVGKSFENGKIIGVVEDYHFQPLHLDIQPIVIELMNNIVEDHTSRAYVAIRLKEIKDPNLLEEMEFISRTVEPSQPFLYYFLNERIESQYETESRLGELFNYFSVAAILIALLGLIGLTLFVTEQKTKEIGIRKVLGADQLSIVNILLGKFTKWIILAVIIAVPGAHYFVSGWLEDFAYRIDITMLPFIISVIMVFIFTFVAVGIQVFKATRKNPIESLRYE